MYFYFIYFYNRCYASYYIYAILISLFFLFLFFNRCYASYYIYAILISFIKIVRYKIEGGSHEVQNILVTKLLHVITSIQMSELSAKYQIEPAINAHCILEKRGLNNFKRKRKKEEERRTFKSSTKYFNEYKQTLK